MKYIVVVAPSGRDGAKDIDAVVDEGKTVSQAKAPLDVALDVCLRIFCVVEGLGSLNDSSGVRCQRFIGSKGNGFERYPFKSGLSWRQFYSRRRVDAMEDGQTAGRGGWVGGVTG